MKDTIITLIIGAIIVVIAFWAGGRSTSQEYKNNLQKEVNIQDKNSAKIDKYSADDMCTIVLHGKLSESGECK